MVWPSRTSALLRSSSAVSFNARRTSIRSIGKPLRPRVRQKRSNRRVQPLGLPEHDVHQLFLLAAQRQLLPQDLNRPGHRGQRISNFMGDAGRHFAHRRQPLLDSRVALELLDAGHVLKRDQEPRAPPRRLEVRRAQADVDVATAVSGAVPPLEPPCAAAAQSLLQLHDELRRELQHFGERPAGHGSK